MQQRLPAGRLSNGYRRLPLISFENWKRGFLVTVAGQRLLWHDTKRPAVFVHKTGEMKSAWRGAGACMPSMASGVSASFVFSSRLVMREEFIASDAHAAIFSLYFSSPGTEIDSLKLRFHDIPQTRWNGLGPRDSHGVHGRVELPRSLQTAAFALDGRFLQSQSAGARSLYFNDGSLVLTLDIPAEVHIGYTRSPADACLLWHAWDKKARNPRGTVRVLPPSAPPETVRINPLHAAGLLGSLSFSGADPDAFQRLNLLIVESARGQEDWKLADLMVCQPDVTLPSAFRREIPQKLSISENGARARNRYAKIRAGFAQYWELCQRRWEEKGLPALQHPSILMPHDTAFANREDLLFSGPDIIFSPNLSGRGEVCSLILPKGEWIHLWTSRVYSSGKVTVYAPFGAPALFYRAESEYAWLFDSIRQIASRL